MDLSQLKGDAEWVLFQKQTQTLHFKAHIKNIVKKLIKCTRGNIKVDLLPSYNLFSLFACWHRHCRSHSLFLCAQKIREPNWINSDTTLNTSLSFQFYYFYIFRLFFAPFSPRELSNNNLVSQALNRNFMQL